VCVCGRRSGVRVQQEVGCACAAGGRVCVCSRRSGVRVQLHGVSASGEEGRCFAGGKGDKGLGGRKWYKADDGAR